MLRCSNRTGGTCAAHKHYLDKRRARETEHLVIEYCKKHLDEWIISRSRSFSETNAPKRASTGGSPMKVSVVALFGVVLSTASPLPCFAGPCSAEIDAIMSRIDAGLEAVAAAGRGGAETAAATTHHQPTPKSIAESEAKLGDVSTKLVDEVGNAMARARSADLAGDGAACEDALAVVRKGLER